jgi:hypothetical protein
MARITTNPNSARAQRSSGESLQQLAQRVGGTVKGDKVEYQVKGAGYKATRYVRVGEEANLASPYDNKRDDGRNNPKNVINGSALQNNALINLPQQAPVKNEMGTIAGANASVVNPTMGITTGANGELVYTPPQTTATTATPAESNFQSYLNAIQGLEAPSASDTYDRLYKESGLSKINNDIQNYTSQINNITAKAQAESLALEGQGRGITESIIGGQQAQISREAAIQALPLQALLANAQGNKELAMTHLDTRYKLQMEDAQSKYQYKLKIIDAVYNFADKQEQRRLDEIARKEDMDFELKKGDIAFERQKYMENLGFANQRSLLSYKAGLDAVGASEEQRVANENGYNQAVSGQQEVQKLLNNEKGLKIITSNLGGVGRFFSTIGNLGTGRVGEEEQGGLGAKNDALASARYVLENLTLDKLGKLETPLTPVSNADVDIVRKASSALAGYADYKTKGEMSTFRGFKGDYASVEKAISDLNIVFKKQIDKNNALLSLTAEEMAALE